MPKVTLPNGIEFECSNSQTILDAAKANKIAIEHRCWSGRCGVCKATVLSRGTKVMRTEKALTAVNEEVFTCCRTPLSDVHLDIADLGEIGNIQALTMPCRIDILDHS